MPDYSKGKIYTIRSHQTDKIYIGSTIQFLNVRFRGHKSKYLMYKNNKYHYVSSFEIIKFDDCYVELLKLCPCETKEELLKHEGEAIRNTNDCVNKCIAGRTCNEYYKDNKQTILAHKNDNKDSRKEYYKQYQENNKDKIADKGKKYYEKNKEIISIKLKQKVLCECGKEYSKGDKSKHIKSEFHLAHII